MDPDLADAEGSYRRGYYQGAWDVIAAVLPFLPPKARGRLERWHEKDVSAWRYENKRRRGPADEIVAEIMPPRSKLHLG